MVAIFPKDRLSPVAAIQHMIHGSGKFNACFTRHVSLLSRPPPALQVSRPDPALHFLRGIGMKEECIKIAGAHRKPRMRCLHIWTEKCVAGLNGTYRPKEHPKTEHES